MCFFITFDQIFPTLLLVCLFCLHAEGRGCIPQSDPALLGSEQHNYPVAILGL